MTQTQDKFVQKVIEIATFTADDEILINGIRKINNYLNQIKGQLSSVNIDQIDFEVAIGNNSCYLKFNDTELQLFRKSNYIRVISSNQTLEDKIIVKDNKLISEQYAEQLSEDLLDKYLSIVFDLSN